ADLGWHRSHLCGTQAAGPAPQRATGCRGSPALHDQPTGNSPARQGGISAVFAPGGLLVSTMARRAGTGDAPRGSEGERGVAVGGGEQRPSPLQDRGGWRSASGLDEASRASRAGEKVRPIGADASRKRASPLRSPSHRSPFRALPPPVGSPRAAPRSPIAGS